MRRYKNSNFSYIFAKNKARKTVQENNMELNIPDQGTVKCLYTADHCSNCSRLNDPEYQELFTRNYAVQFSAFKDLGYASKYPMILSISDAGELMENLSIAQSYRRFNNPDEDIIKISVSLENSKQNKIFVTDLIHLVAHTYTSQQLDQLVNSHI